MKKITLNEVARGKRARILSLDSDPHFKTRLQEMGLTVGVELMVEFKAPLGGSIAVTCRGALLALRSEEAASIGVEC